jgi:hypothetical protein
MTFSRQYDVASPAITDLAAAGEPHPLRLDFTSGSAPEPTYTLAAFEHGGRSADPGAYDAIPSDDTNLVQYITLNTIDQEQLDWLEAQLRVNSSTYLVDSVPNTGVMALDGPGLTPGVPSKVVHQPGVTDKLFVIFCNHILDTMSGDDLRQVLLAYPNVVLMLNGHPEANLINAVPRAAENILIGGFWEMNTASHIDWPVRGRIVEIASGGGLVSVFATIGDRNVRLLVPAPFILPDPPVIPGPWFFHANGHFLWQLDPDGSAHPAGNGLGVQQGTSPSIAVRSTGEYLAVFQSLADTGDGSLWQLDQTGFWRLSGDGLSVSQGTSPSVAALAGGGYQIAFQAANSSGAGRLWLVDPDGMPVDTQLPMRPGSSPVIAASPAGGYLLAYVDDEGYLTLLDETGTVRHHGNGLTVMAGTRPSITAGILTGYTIAGQGADGMLWTVTGDGTQTATGLDMAPGSSPCVTATLDGPVIAFQRGDGNLWIRLPDGTVVWPGSALAMAPGTDPSISAYDGGFGYQIAFQGKNGLLWKVDHLGTVSLPGIGLEMAPGTSPATVTAYGKVSPPA